VVMRRFDDAIDFPSRCAPHRAPAAATAGACRRVSRRGEERGGGKPWAACGFMADVASELTA
jgi:hypothetical protein